MPDTRIPEISAVVVSYNSAADLRRQLSAPGMCEGFARIVVVDNGSSDDSAEVAASLGAEVHVLRDNPGFGAAVNFGVAQTDTEFFVVLNPDVYFEDVAAVRALLSTLDDPTVGMAGPGLVLPAGDLQDSARDVPAPWHLLARRLTGSQVGAVAREGSHDVDWIVGACMFIRRAAFDAVGGFDERYHLYFEDVDLCVRFWQQGWRVTYHAEVRARHDHRAESRSTFFGPAMRRHLNGAQTFYRAHPHLTRASARRRLQLLEPAGVSG